MPRIMSQREAVYEHTKTIWSKCFGTDFKAGDLNKLDRNQRMTIRGLVVTKIMKGINSGSITMSSHMSQRLSDNAAFKRYVNGLVNNWWLKDYRIAEAGYTGTVRLGGYNAGIPKSDKGNDIGKIVYDEYPKSTLNPDGKSRACECGARHTSRPDYHMSYCPLKKW